MSKPNVIFVITDDLGYGDLSCMGTEDFRTPFMDEIAGRGILFRSMYSNSPVCSPSRASLLTGRYPGYAGVRSILAGHRRATGIKPTTPTIASMLRGAGYRTGLVGKWHLGLVDQSRPNQNGFDYFYGFMAGCVDYYSHIFYWGMADGHTNPSHDLWENGDEIYRNGEYLTELITEKSVEYIRERSHDDEPFFLCVSYNAPHYPMHAPQKYLDRFPDLPWDRQIMAAMISAVDDGIGAIKAELQRQNIFENTIIYFQSDNGPSRESRNWMDGREDPYYGGTSGIFKGHKFSLFEGGIRVPAFFSWPARIEEGRVEDAPSMAMDMVPTILEAAGVPNAWEVDGVSLLPLLLRRQAVEREAALYWETDQQRAIRKGDYKLVLNGVLEEGEDVGAPTFLSNLAEDPSETTNLAEAQPELVREMEDEVLRWYGAMEAYWNEHFAGDGGSLT